MCETEWKKELDIIDKKIYNFFFCWSHKLNFFTGFTQKKNPQNIIFTF